MSFSILHTNKNNYLVKSLINVENTSLFKKNEIMFRCPRFWAVLCKWDSVSSSESSRAFGSLISHIQICDVTLK